MKISVIIPVYNAQKHLRHTIDSVIAQTHTDWECICVDDGSTDGSGEILDNYAAKDSRFRILHQANGGEGAARNSGMGIATGELITFLDADDRMHPKALYLFCEWQNNTHFDMLRYEALPVSDSNSQFAPLTDSPICEYVDFSKCGESPFVFCALGWATVVTRELSQRLKWTALKQGADMVFVMDCLLATRSTYRTRERLVNYYMDPNSISRKLSVGLLQGTCDYLTIIMTKADELGISNEMRNAGEALARDMLLCRLPGSWRLLDDANGQQTVERSFWRALRSMSARPSFCRGISRRALTISVEHESLVLLRLLVTLPYKLWKSIRKPFTHR